MKLLISALVTLAFSLMAQAQSNEMASGEESQDTVQPTLSQATQPDLACVDRCWDRFDNQGISPSAHPGYHMCLKQECGATLVSSGGPRPLLKPKSRTEKVKFDEPQVRQCLERCAMSEQKNIPGGPTLTDRYRLCVRNCVN